MKSNKIFMVDIPGDPFKPLDPLRPISPIEVARSVNPSSSIGFVSPAGEGGDVALRSLEPIQRGMSATQYPRTIVQTGGLVSAALTAKLFLSSNVGAIVASGSVTAIGLASTLVVGAGAVGYGLGTLVNRIFNLSDRGGNGLYSLFGDSLYKFFS